MSEHLCGLQGYCPGPPHFDPLCPACVQWAADARGVAPAPPDNLDAVRQRYDAIRAKWSRPIVPREGAHDDVNWLLAALRDWPWLKQDYSRITGMLQDTCQEFGLGLGGEDTCELVTAEIRALLSALSAARARATEAEQKFANAMKCNDLLLESADMIAAAARREALEEAAKAIDAEAAERGNRFVQGDMDSEVRATQSASAMYKAARVVRALAAPAAPDPDTKK